MNFIGVVMLSTFVFLLIEQVFKPILNDFMKYFTYNKQVDESYDKFTFLKLFREGKAYNSSD